MDLNNKVTQLEDEIKVLKKEVQAVLLDLRENMLNRENPFSPQALQPQAAPAVNATTAALLPPPVEKKKEPPTEDLLKEALANEELELPAAITDAFKADERAKLPKGAKNPTQAPDQNGSLLASKPAGYSGKSEGLPENKDVLETITSLVGWVENSVARLGFERTQAMLDISEMMGHMSPEMKNILIKFLHPGSEPVEKVAFKDYMASLLELTSMLGKKNDPNNVLFYTLYHGMYPMTEGRDKHG